MYVYKYMYVCMYIYIYIYIHIKYKIHYIFKSVAKCTLQFMCVRIGYKLQKREKTTENFPYTINIIFSA